MSRKPMVAVEGALEVGRGAIHPAPDTPVHLLTAEGIPCGLWVRGPASFTYRVEDRFSQPVAKRNLKSASRLDELHAAAGDYAGRLRTLELAAQPMGRNWWDPVPYPFAMTDVEVEVKAEKPPLARVHSNTRIESRTAGLRLISLSVPDVMRDTDGDLRPVAILSVAVDGAPAASVRLGSTLLVPIGRELAPGTTVTVETETEGAFAVRPGKDNYWTMGGGELVAGKYRTVEAERDGFKVKVSSYVHPKKDEAERLANNSFAAKECYERWFEVPYPSAELDTAEGFLAAATSRGANERFAHEVAHGYFPHVARPELNEESWLSESFAEYASTVCIQNTSADPREGNRRFERQLAEWKAMTRELGDGASIFLAEHLSGDDDKDYMARSGLLYGKGPVVLHAIRQELGRLGKGTKEGTDSSSPSCERWCRTSPTNRWRRDTWSESSIR